MTSFSVGRTPSTGPLLQVAGQRSDALQAVVELARNISSPRNIRVSVWKKHSWQRATVTGGCVSENASGTVLGNAGSTIATLSRTQRSVRSSSAQVEHCEMVSALAEAKQVQEIPSEYHEETYINPQRARQQQKRARSVLHQWQVPILAQLACEKSGRRCRQFVERSTSHETSKHDEILRDRTDGFREKWRVDRHGCDGRVFREWLVFRGGIDLTNSGNQLLSKKIPEI